MSSSLFFYVCLGHTICNFMTKVKKSKYGGRGTLGMTFLVVFIAAVHGTAKYFKVVKI